MGITRASLNEKPVSLKLPWRRLFGYAYKLKTRFIVAALGTLVATIASVIFPVLIGQGIADVVNSKDTGALNLLALLLIVIFFVHAVAQFFQYHFVTYIGATVVYRIRRALYKKLLSSDAPFYAHHKSGELNSRLSNDTTTLQAIFDTVLPQVLTSMLTLVGTVTFMIILNPLLTLFIFAIAPFIATIAIIIGRKIQKLGLKSQDQLAELGSGATETFKNISIVKSFTAEKYEQDRFNSKLYDLKQTLIHVSRYSSLGFSLIGFMGFGAIALIVWFAGGQVIQGALSLGLITTFLIYGIQIATEMGQLAMLFSQYKKATGASRRVFELLDYENTYEPTGEKDVVVASSITLQGVSFGYQDHEVLKDLSFSVKSGETVALVGPSGAGKTTVFELLQRYYEPSRGIIKYGALNVKDIHPETLRKSIAVVSQQAPLFSGTIRENIAYGMQTYREEDIYAAAKAAEAHDFIMKLPLGYDTVLSEGGAGLSGGQRQRISIARAVLKNAPILLLDEATSALDNTSERKVQQAITKLMKGRTTIIIAHRLATIINADKIIVMHEGAVVEEGVHDALIAQNGFYAELYMN